MMRSALVVAAVVVATPLSAQQPYTPLVMRTVRGRFFRCWPSAEVRPSWSSPSVPDGAVQKVTPLRSTPPFTQGLIDAVTGVAFLARRRRRASARTGGPRARSPSRPESWSRRCSGAPTLLTPTLGEKTVNVGAASPEVAYPSATNEPPYPPQALSGGVVLVEVSVDGAGAVRPRA